jgi:hypothetical protein
MTRVNHADSTMSSDKMIITWVQTAPPHAIPIHSQLLARKIPGNFRLEPNRRILHLFPHQIDLHHVHDLFQIASTGWQVRGAVVTRI